MSAAGGGSFSSRSYTYDLRGNVTQTGADTLPVKYYAYQTAPLSDRLASQKNCSGSCPATPLEYLYSFNHDGTISSKVSANDSSGTPALGYQFAPGPGSGGGGLDMVFHSVSVNGAAYNYFYDARNRRRYKSYPAGVSDEFFYSPRNFMLVDQGNSSVTTPTYYTDDDYVWLDGHPVVLVHGQLSTAWVRQSDTTTSCGRNGDVGECGFYFPVSDYAKKPVVMLNSSQLVTGVGEYEPLGQANRVEMDSETAHPYTTTQTGFGTFTPGSIGGTTSQLRVKFQMIDTQLRTFGCSGSPDRVDLVDQSTSSILATQDGRSPWWSPWVSPASISGVRADLVVNNPQIQTCLPTCICVAHSNTIRKGASIESYEYRRVQTGATAFWTPIRFQGQYHDEETDLNQNWNRFYEPLTGRYLEPEPMLALGEYLVDVAKVAGQVSVYGYASNDPVSHGDPTGHQVCGNRPGSIIEQTKDDCDRLVDQMTGALNSKIVDMMKVLATTIAQATMGPEDFCAMYHQAIYDQAMYADSLPQGCDKAKAYYDLTEIVLEAESVGCFKNFKPPPGSNSSGNLP
jgi:RHS repeat-associated protein